MNPEELERGKWYRVTSIKGELTALFQFKGIDEDLTNSTCIVIDFINKGVNVKEDSITINRRWGTYYYTDLIEEIDESIFNKVIKQFNMDKAAILATINQDKSNEKKGNTAQGDYQLP